MRIRIGDKEYNCGKVSLTSTSIQWPEVENLVTPVSGTIVTYRNDGFILREDLVSNYLYQYYYNHTLILANTQEFAPTSAPVSTVEYVEFSTLASAIKEGVNMI